MRGNPYESPTNISGSAPERASAKMRLSPGVLAVLINFVLWHLGIYFNSFGGWVDQWGAVVCVTTYGVAWFLVPTTVVYCFVRRFGLSVRQWDLYGPSLAIICVLIMCWQLKIHVRM
jgi:hypothetical protein